jgi:hypothetical protein
MFRMRHSLSRRPTCFFHRHRRLKEYASYLEPDQIEIKTLSREDGDAIDERSLAVGRRRVGD